LGGYQYDKLLEPAGHWRWVTGEPWSYTNWNKGEPNNYLNVEDYLMMWNYNKWNDGVTQGGGYIIEWNTNPVPLPGAVWLLGSGLLVLAGLRRFSFCKVRTAHHPGAPHRKATSGGHGGPPHRGICRVRTVRTILGSKPLAG
jgi:hypothetical protein